MTRTFEALANVSTVVIAVCALWIATTRGQSVASGPPPAPAYKVGDVFSGVQGLRLADSERTLLIAVKSDCKFCTASMPLYREIIAQRSARNSHLRVVVVAPGNDTGFEGYLATHGLKADEALTFTPGALKVRGTPTLLLLDSAGQVKQVWEGAVSGGAEEALLKTIFPG